MFRRIHNLSRNIVDQPILRASGDLDGPLCDREAVRSAHNHDLQHQSVQDQIRCGPTQRGEPDVDRGGTSRLQYCLPEIAGIFESYARLYVDTG